MDKRRLRDCPLPKAVQLLMMEPWPGLSGSNGCAVCKPLGGGRGWGGFSSLAPIWKLNCPFQLGSPLLWGNPVPRMFSRIPDNSPLEPVRALPSPFVTSRNVCGHSWEFPERQKSAPRETNALWYQWSSNWGKTRISVWETWTKWRIPG